VAYSLKTGVGSWIPKLLCMSYTRRAYSFYVLPGFIRWWLLPLAILTDGSAAPSYTFGFGQISEDAPRSWSLFLRSDVHLATIRRRLLSMLNHALTGFIATFWKKIMISVYCIAYCLVDFLKLISTSPSWTPTIDEEPLEIPRWWRWALWSLCLA
jgi:hypothetical protein